MILYGDYHTHTIYSNPNHAKGTILQNATVASEKGLKQIAITDHGFNHMFFSLNRKLLPQMREEILNAKEVTGVDILLGVESNLISTHGQVDLKESDYDDLDIILMGFHKLVKTPTLKDFLQLQAVNMLSSPYRASEKRIARNTSAFLKALDKYPIDIITHLNFGCPTDTLAVARLAKQKGVLIELNGKHINFTDDEILTMAGEGVKFIVDSDAHTPSRVGECNRAINLIYRLNLPTNLIVNLDKLPTFQKKRGQN